ncbi:hypothetical protein [Lentibacillus amyloliquefaciens]|nr:hypothetical protein [Lentibacillus amyloliquefaciens]
MIFTTCSVCKTYADDGGLKNGEFVCHDCLSLIDGIELKINELIKAGKSS